MPHLQAVSCVTGICLSEGVCWERGICRLWYLMGLHACRWSARKYSGSVGMQALMHHSVYLQGPYSSQYHVSRERGERAV